MKIKGKDYTDLLDLIQNSPALPLWDEYREGCLSDKRYRWDCFWRADGEKRSEWARRVYEYADDTHIDTALRHIVSYLYVNEERV